MKTSSILVAVAALAAKVSAHYTFPGLILNGTTSPDWQYVRQTNNFQDLNPVTDVTSTDIRCYTSLESGTAPSIATVAAGSTIGFSVPITMYHAGVVNVYMAKAPTGTDVASWDGSGNVWFKVVFQIPAVADGVTINFPAENLATVVFTVPSQLPSGQYLIRVENIALHVAFDFAGESRFLTILRRGNGTPGPLVSFPGAYTGNEPGILINIYFPIPTTYIQPGPAVWPASGSGAVSSSVHPFNPSTTEYLPGIARTPDLELDDGHQDDPTRDHHHGFDNEGFNNYNRDEDDDEHRSDEHRYRGGVGTVRWPGQSHPHPPSRRENKC
ncbi:glycosyl hydrolase family 61-domain-containing protein [Mycena filopes]|nr:glycosyl hydrolase family 61-domain-containing protein [Mycena filopes]